MKNQNDVLDSIQSLAESNAALVQQIAEDKANEPRKVSINDYKEATPWNPEGKTRKTQLTRVVIVNGARLKEWMLSTEDIELLNGLKGGRYHGRKWQVIVRGEDGESTIEIRWPNRTPQQQIQFTNEAGSLTQALRLMAAEYAEKRQRGGFVEED